MAAKSQSAETSHTNRLAGETSPYLLQHAHNPVDWYPWGPAALERAGREHKAIFLSIGYSACHWCHVMERESFEDRATAELLNQHFVCIKVDREVRPDLDEIYMAAVQMLTGSGGWPLSVFLTPELKPFFGGTYFPPEERHGLPGFRTLLARVADLWEHRRTEVLDSAEQIAKAVCAHTESAGGGTQGLVREQPELAVAELTAVFDVRWGGFGTAPKFPPAAALAFLLRRYAHTQRAGLLQQVTLTLDRMAAGGLHDQLGGGFHRYAVDAQWRVPHFEKMLYDNAQLADVYRAAWQVTGQARYRRAATATLDYVLRDLTAPDGGFYSSQDADSEGQEGQFYVWTPDEIHRLLGAADGALFCKFYGVETRGNFEGRSILHVPRELDRFAREEKIDAAPLAQQLDGWCAKVRALRERRPHPGRDEKVLTAWNALMISALARASRAFDAPRYRLAAEKAADFIMANMRAEGRLLRTGHAVGSRQTAFLDDYALLGNALLDLYESTLDVRRLDAADELVRQMVELFRDDKSGGFFMISADQPRVLARPKPAFDGQEPSGNSAAALALWRLGRLLEKPDYLTEAERTLKAFASAMRQTPRGFLNMVDMLDGYFNPGPEIVIVGLADAPETRALWQEVYHHYLPGSVWTGFDPTQSDAAALVRRIPLLAGRQARAGRATAYVCRQHACHEPVYTAEALRELLP